MADNAAMFERLRFDDAICRGLHGDDLVMMYLARGKWRGGDEFAPRGIEFVTMRHGSVARKDAFWKQYRRES